jgi:nucleoside 2-deoxyribosyltransferase
MKIYCVGPITGLSAIDVFNYYDKIKKDLNEIGYEVLSPMTGKDHMRNEEEFKSEGYQCSPLTKDNAIFNRDRWMVQHSDVVFADFTRGKERASIGTCFELAWANAHGKLIISVIPTGNIHQHLFIKQASAAVFETTAEAIEYLKLLKA